MEALECIMTRRSVRKYRDEAVPEKTLHNLLEAGANAPSAGNQQPWNFITITDKNTLEKISEFPTERCCRMRHAP